MIGLPEKYNSILQQWHKLFTNHKITRSTQAYLHWKNIERLGIPNDQDENWKHFPLKKLSSYQFIPVIPYSISMTEVDALSLKINAYRLVFVDGKLVPNLSDNNIGVWHFKVENGLTCQPLQAPIRPEIFLHLTESLTEQITRIYLPSKQLADKPLYLLHLSNSQENKYDLNMIHYRHHIDIGYKAHGLIIEHFVSLTSYANFIGTRTSINLADNSYCNYIKLILENNNSYHFAHNDIHIGKSVITCNNTFILNSGFSKHQTSIQLNDENTNLTINSLLIPNRHSSNNVDSYIQHNQKHCISKQLHKIIARDHGRGIFNGLIKITKYASKTDASIMSNNLLLNTSAKVIISPRMEIRTDDVKCKHAIIVDKLDDEQIFYMSSRGISNDNAQKMMIYAFANEVIDTIHHNEIYENILLCVNKCLEESL